MPLVSGAGDASKVIGSSLFQPPLPACCPPPSSLLSPSAPLLLLFSA